MIFPEGGTTNGHHLIKFKKGAFAGLNSVQPICIKYHAHNDYNNQACSINFGLSLYSMIHSFGVTETRKVFPVFKPNEYFWQHHWNKDSGEEKWEAYCRVIREEIMAPSHGFGLSNATIEEKL